MLKFLRKNRSIKISLQASANKECENFLSTSSLMPVFADVGSAGKSHDIWQSVASQSMIIGFDPDSRNEDTNFGKGYKKSLMISKAVTPEQDSETVEFFLTKYPSCSSTLEPDLNELESFSFHDYFLPDSKTEAPAITLNKVIADENLPAIHWLKLDSQGIDLRILKSLSTDNFNNLLAVDIEPGLVKAYKNEDLFTDCHSWLIDNGFWLSQLEYQAYPKCRPSTMEEISGKIGKPVKNLIRQLPRTPTAVEGRYMREVNWYEKMDIRQEHYLIGAVFGLLDSQYPYVIDLMNSYIKKFGDDENTRTVKRVAYEKI